MADSAIEVDKHAIKTAVAITAAPQEPIILKEMILNSCPALAMSPCP